MSERIFDFSTQVERIIKRIRNASEGYRSITLNAREVQILCITIFAEGEEIAVPYPDYTPPATPTTKEIEG